MSSPITLAPSPFLSTAFAPLVGQPQAVELLTQAVLRQRVSPAYLFAGPDGIGRRLAAYCFIECLYSQTLTDESSWLSVRKRIHQGNHPDLLWVRPTYLHQGRRISATEAEAEGLSRKSPPIIRLEQVRELGQFLSRPPLQADRAVIVLEQAETMPEAAANALLKTLEEPGKATLILLAPNVESLLPTLVSRCQRIPFYRLSKELMEQVLQQTGQGEILNYPEILTIAQGSPGAAIVAFQKQQSIPAELLEQCDRPPTSLREALELARTLTKALDTEQQIWLIDYLQHRHWQAFGRQGGTASAWLHQLEKARKQLLSYAQPRLVWEVTLMERVG